MKKTIGFILLLFMLFVDGMNAQTKDNYPANYARAPRFKALIYYTTYAEEAHPVVEEALAPRRLGRIISIPAAVCFRSHRNLRGSFGV